MKRILGIFSSAAVALMLVFGNAGCDDKTKVEKKETVTTPGGKEEKTTTTEVKKSGDAKDKDMEPKK